MIFILRNEDEQLYCKIEYNQTLPRFTAGLLPKILPQRTECGNYKQNSNNYYANHK